MRLRPVAIAILVLCVAATAAVAVPDGLSDGEWKDLRSAFKKASRNPDVNARVDALETLAVADRLESAELVVEAMEISERIRMSLEKKRDAKKKEISEVSYGTGNKKQITPEALRKIQELTAELKAINADIADEKRVGETAVTVLQGHRDPDAIAFLVETARDTRSLTMRRLLLEAVAGSWRRLAASADEADAAAAERMGTVLRELLADEDATVRSLAADGLAGVDDPELIPVFQGLLGDEAWQVRAAAIRGLVALGKAEHWDVVVILIDQLEEESGRLRADLVRGLRAITGGTNAASAEGWRIWWKHNKDKVMAGEGPAARGEGGGGEDADYYGIPIYSKKLVFILDRTGSMNEPAETRARVYTGGRGIPGPDPPGEDATKLDVAKYELANAVRRLKSDVHFTMIFFNDEVTVWSRRLLPAEDRVKRKALEAIDELTGEGMTNIFDPLATAFELAGQGAFDRNYETGVDTIFLLSDGHPNSGSVIEPARIREQILEKNALRKIVIHTIGVGDHDEGLMRGLAEDSGGQYKAFD